MSGSSGEARDRLRMRDVMLPFRRTIADQDLRSALDPVECVSRLTRLADARLEVQVEPSSAVRLRARGYPLACSRSRSRSSIRRIFPVRVLGSEGTNSTRRG